MQNFEIVESSDVLESMFSKCQFFFCHTKSDPLFSRISVRMINVIRWKHRWGVYMWHHDHHVAKEFIVCLVQHETSIACQFWQEFIFSMRFRTTHWLISIFSSNPLSAERHCLWYFGWRNNQTISKKESFDKWISLSIGIIKYKDNFCEWKKEYKYRIMHCIMIKITKIIDA